MQGAMENAGLVTYNDPLLLLSPDAPPSQRRGFGTVVAHELAHQWFGDLVAPVWWNDIWLNEVFAEWAGNRVGEIWDPKLGTGVAQLSEALDAMEIDSLPGGRPIRQPIATNAGIASAFDSITYQKGGQVLTMVERYLGLKSSAPGCARTSIASATAVRPRRISSPRWPGGRAMRGSCRCSRAS
ncbi:M1 family aminopeptidase [Sphingomonas sp. MMS24-JH45]